jgi:hypothetical protein
MSESDVLTIRLFIAATGIAFGTVGMTAAGWKHVYFIWGMFALAVLLIVSAIFWPLLAPVTIGRDGLLLSVARSPISWFVMSVGAIVAVALIGKARNDTSPLFNHNGNLTRVFRQNFKNETVHLDGMDYVECSFENVQFRYDGRRIGRLTNCQLHHPGLSLATRNSGIGYAINFLHAISAPSGDKKPFELGIRPP